MQFSQAKSQYFYFFVSFLIFKNADKSIEIYKIRNETELIAKIKRKKKRLLEKKRRTPLEESLEDELTNKSTGEKLVSFRFKLE